jgi:hypothetical protein
MLSMGSAACFIDRVEPMAAIFCRIIAEAAQCRERLDRLMPEAASAPA